jgi:threonine synthase
MTFLVNLQCSECGKLFNSEQIQTFCQICQAPLLARYDLKKANRVLDRDSIRVRSHGMWRWHELLPVQAEENRVSLGEGDTPLLSLPRLGNALGLRHLYVKDESLNPTGTFKARGLSAAVSKAKEFGIKKIIIPSAGNAGGALAAYAACSGMQACIYMAKGAPQANIEECLIYGAQVIVVDGLIGEASIQASIKALEEGWFDISTFKEPYRTEGKKIMGYELAEEFRWYLPDVIIYPTGGGTGLVGMWKAFAELEALGWLNDNKRPRMVSVQAEGCAPVVTAFNNGAQFCDYWKEAHTFASGLCVPKSFADRMILRDLRTSLGNAVAVSDEQMMQAQRQLATTEGIFAAPEGAATLAALIQLKQNGWVQSDEQIVIFNTGTGLKYLK